MAGKRNPGFIAYREDGTTFTFGHKVDWRTAIKQGMFSAKNPLEKSVAVPVETAVEVEQEVIEGVEEVKPKSTIPESGLNIVDETDGKKKRIARK